jgi:hypothetical protein
VISDPFDEGSLIAFPIAVVMNIAEAFTEQSMEIFELVLHARAGLRAATGRRA